MRNHVSRPWLDFCGTPYAKENSKRARDSNRFVVFFWSWSLSPQPSSKPSIPIRLFPLPIRKQKNHQWIKHHFRLLRAKVIKRSLFNRNEMWLRASVYDSKCSKYGSYSRFALMCVSVWSRQTCVRWMNAAHETSLSVDSQRKWIMFVYTVASSKSHIL